jgi:hypothetical protein
LPGCILSENGISASPEKVKAVRQYPTPKCVRDVRAFLGLASFYRRLVPDFAEIAKPLSQLTRKGQEFLWGSRQQEAFEIWIAKYWGSAKPFFQYTTVGKPLGRTRQCGIIIKTVLTEMQWEMGLNLCGPE